VHPILFRIGGFEVVSYSLALAIAFAAGVWVACRRAPRHGVDPELILEVGTAAVVSSLVGSRLLWVVTHPAEFQPPHGTWTDAFGLAGLSMQGGIVLAAITCLAWIAYRRGPILRTTDLCFTSVALGESITRIGCFLNGCCHGVASGVPWAVSFPAGSLPWQVLGDAALHPTQLYAAAGSLALFAALSAWLAREPAPGAVAAGWLAGTGLVRIAVDAFRYYEPEVTLGSVGGVAVTVNTPVSLAMLVAGAALWIAVTRRRAARSAAAP
jgi:phosphatidylglycerol:prolipoprotein diacylglycerol transferase